MVRLDALALRITSKQPAFTIYVTSFDSLVNEQRVEVCFVLFLTLIYDYFFFIVVTICKIKFITSTILKCAMQRH